MPQRKLQGFQRLIETDDFQTSREIARVLNYRDRIGRRAEPDIPDGKSVAPLQSFTQSELLNVKRLGFGGWAYHRMECFVVFPRINAGSAADQPDNLVSVATHGTQSI